MSVLPQVDSIPGNVLVPPTQDQRNAQYGLPANISSITYLSAAESPDGEAEDVPLFQLRVRQRPFACNTNNVQ
jgi:hypothetical protein